MSTSKGGWFIPVVVAVVVGTVLALQWQATGQLRDEVNMRRKLGHELAGLQQQHGELLQKQIPVADLESLRADRAALLRLRAEIETLKTNAERPRPAQESKAPPLAAKSPAMFIPASDWKNVGRATPAAAFETALWAAVGGDIDALAAGMSFEAGAREKADAILAKLPPDLRAQYSTPEKLVALFTAKDVPLDSAMRVLAEGRMSENDVRLAVMFEVGNQKTEPAATKRVPVRQERELALRREGNNWKLVVPGTAVEKYGAILAGGPIPTAVAK
jgi:hypothetical protein